MTKRFAYIHKLAQIRHDVAVFPDNTDTIIRNAIIRALPPAYHKLYDWISQGTFHGEVNTNMVMKAWDWKPNYASTMLNELWQFGLLSREEYTDEHGKGYKYKIAP
jgi:hypothetical protein